MTALSTIAACSFFVIGGMAGYLIGAIARNGSWGDGYRQGRRAGHVEGVREARKDMARGMR